MTTLTIHLAEKTASRLKSLAQRRSLSVDELMEELSTQTLAAWDTENRFRILAAQGDVQAALDILDQIDSKTKGH